MNKKQEAILIGVLTTAILATGAVTLGAFNSASADLKTTRTVPDKSGFTNVGGKRIRAFVP